MQACSTLIIYIFHFILLIMRCTKLRSLRQYVYPIFLFFFTSPFNHCQSTSRLRGRFWLEPVLAASCTDPMRALLVTSFNPFLRLARPLTAKHRTISSSAVMSSTEAPFSDLHTTGEWYSVPDLRLREHRFIVPLDYTAREDTITVFAREVVGGNFAFDP